MVTVERIGYGGKLYRRVVKAVYFPYHHCTVEDMGWNMCDGIPDDWEYIEDKLRAVIRNDEKLKLYYQENQREH